MNSKATIQRLNKDEYIDLATGEIKEYKHIENRSKAIILCDKLLKRFVT